MIRERAIELAQETAKAENWPWLEPIYAVSLRRWWIGSVVWKVISNADSRGTNVRVVIDDATGHIIKKEFFPR